MQRAVKANGKRRLDGSSTTGASFNMDIDMFHHLFKDDIDFGTPLGVGPYANQKDQIKRDWKKDIAAIAKCDNVVAKIGGLAMPDNGFGWETKDKPPSSDEFAEAQREYYLHTIECFGPDRCMMESNFPVDRMSLSYHVLYNGLKKIVKDFSQTEKDQMFYGTAERIYKL